MPYQTITCPACGNVVQAQIKRNEPGMYVGLHTRQDGTGRMCAGVGAEGLRPGQKVESHS